MKKIIRTSTIPLSLCLFCKGLMEDLSDTYEITALSSPGKELDTIGKSGKVKTIELPMERKIAPIKDLISLLRLIFVLIREKPDMVHSITPKAGLLSMIASKIAGVPNRVHTFTGLVFPTSRGLKRKILASCDKITCACASKVLAEGNGVKDDLINNRITSKQIAIIGNGNMRGIDLEYYNPELSAEQGKNLKDSLRIKDTSIVFIFVGRVVGDKGISELLNAFKRILTDGIDSHLLIVGETESDDNISEEDLRFIEENSSVYYTKKWVDDVRPYYSAADILVLPSYREGFPNVVLEAGAMKLPSIVTDINGSREIVINGENGCVIPPKDSDNLYIQMKNLALDRELRMIMGEKARKNISEKFEQNFIRNCHREFYRSLLE